MRRRVALFSLNHFRLLCSAAVHPFARWGGAGAVEFQKTVSRLRPTGGTQISEGMRVATEQYKCALFSFPPGIEPDLESAGC